MKISQLIEMLQEVQAEHGHVPFARRWDDHSLEITGYKIKIHWVENYSATRVGDVEDPMPKVVVEIS
jgi:hypothetical protein